MRIAWPLLLCLGVAHAGDPIADHDKAFGRPELARIGTVGDRPPMESTLVVHVHAKGVILIDGKDTTLDELSGALAALRARHAEPSVLLRADATLPWGAVHVLLTICAEQKVDRVFHAVLPGAGEEGAFSWPLALEREFDPTSVASEKPAAVMVTSGVPEAKPANVYWAAREAKPEVVELKIGRFVPLGTVLGVADALCRAGVRSVLLYGYAIPTREERRGNLGPVMKRLELPSYGADQPEKVDRTKVRVRFGDKQLEGKASPMPAVDRVTGRTAGWEGPVYPPDVPEEVEEPQAPEPEVPEETVEGDGTGGDAAGEPNPDDGAPGGMPADDGERGLSDAGNPGAGGMPRDLKRRRLDAAAVVLGLEWLAAHQDVDEDGKWDCDGFMKHDPEGDRCDGAGGAANDVGVTGLALLAFLGAGYTDRGEPRENRYAANVRAGLRFLMRAQAEDGAFGPREAPSFMYNHAIAALALSEAYWMTRNPRYKRPAQLGLDFLAAARNPDAAWRYKPRCGDNDTSVTAWCLMALMSGQTADLDIDPAVLKGARAWIDRMTDPGTSRVGYVVRGGPPQRVDGAEARWPAARSQSTTAAAILCRIWLGDCSDAVFRGAKLCAASPPSWDTDAGTIDMHYWYWGTLALFQVSGEPWDAWTKAIDGAIVKHQHPKGSGAKAGSWDPLDPWGADGGRVYSTALLTMTLEVHYRYGLRLSGSR